MRKNGGETIMQKLSTTLALAVLTIIIGTVTARAQTTAVGPYYAWPSWDQTLPSSTRFIVLSNMNSEAVLDRETGLVWAKAVNPSGQLFWASANATCLDSKKGNRAGWRLPTVNELASLFDPSATVAPHLPSGHPFTGLPSQDGLFWTVSTSTTVGAGFHFVVGYRLQGGSSDLTLNTVASDPGSHGVWCVRGGTFAGPQ
jgi:Protein of unknown function (DUF1566)